MRVGDILGRLLGGVMVVAFALLLLVLFSSASKGGTPAQEGFTPPPEPTGTFIVPTPVPIPTYTPVPTLPPSEFVVTRVIPLPPEMHFLGWAPDGERILLGKWLGYHNVGRVGYSSFELWAANYDGGGLVNLASPALTRGWLPAWSPDGESVAYVAPSGPERPSGEIRVVNSRDLTSRTLAQGDIGPGQWLPSGEVTFLRGGNIWAVGRDGRQERQLNNMASLAAPADSDYGYQVSPDGERVVFHYRRIDSETRAWNDYMWIAGLDGSNAVLINDRGVLLVGPPVWAPDSSKVAWVTEHTPQGGYMQIWVVNADGSGKREIIKTGDMGINSNVSWSPDGKVLAFSGGYWEGESTIRLINIDGRDLRVLDTSLEDVSNPIWSPDGKKIAIYKMVPEPEGQEFILEVARR